MPTSSVEIGYTEIKKLCQRAARAVFSYKHMEVKDH